MKEKGIPKSFIHMQPLSNDRDLAKHILEQAGEDAEWPLIFVDGSPIPVIINSLIYTILFIYNIIGYRCMVKSATRFHCFCFIRECSVW